MKRYAAIAALGLLATTGLTVTTSEPAGADDPSGPTLTKAAWFDATYPTTTPVAPPAPVGVGAGDLYVAGTTLPIASTLPLSLPTQVDDSSLGTVSSVLAFAALSFTIPAGSSPASLTLALTSGLQTSTIDAKTPLAVALEACPTTSDFAAGTQQAIDKAPTYDCTGKTSIANLSADGSSVVFSDIGRIAKGKTLSFVVLPYTTGADRLVFQPPTSASLSLLSFDSAPTFDSSGLLVLTPPLVSPPAVSVEPRRVARKTDVRSRAVAIPSSASLPAGSPPVTVPASAVHPAAARAADHVTSPLIAAAPPAAATASAASTPSLQNAAASDPVDDTRTQLLALGGLSLLISAMALVAYTDRRRENEPGVWGHGRFRQARVGAAPRI